MLLALLALVVLPPQVPGVVAGKGPAARWVDFHAELDRPALTVVIGTLGKLKEGKRERLPDGKLGGSTASASVSGTQYFKTVATAPVDVQKTLLGAPAEKPSLQFEVQIARLPDGKERRQLTTGSGTPVAEGALGMFVFDPAAKGKSAQLIALVPFDAAQFDGAQWNGGRAEAAFGDAMADVVAVNVYLHALEQALAAVDAAKGDDALARARAALKGVLDKKPEMKRTDDDQLLSMHAGPLEARAKKRLDG
jgi:hypothetical protein